VTLCGRYVTLGQVIDIIESYKFVIYGYRNPTKFIECGELMYNYLIIPVLLEGMNVNFDQASRTRYSNLRKCMEREERNLSDEP